MKQLESFTIEQFRGLKSLELQGLGRVNLLFGRNNSGKTTVLEALACYARPLDGLHWVSMALRRSGLSLRRSRVEALKWLFPQESNSSPLLLYEGGTISLRASGSCSPVRCEAELREVVGILSREPEPIIGSLEDRSGDEREEAAKRRGAQLHLQVHKRDGGFDRGKLTVWDERNLVRREARAEWAFPMAFISLNDYRSDFASATRFSEFRKQGLYDDALEVLRRLDPGVRELLVLSDGNGVPGLYIEHERTGLTPLGVCGDGMRRAVHIALTVPLVKGGVLLVDEIESALHVSVLAQVFELLARACEEHDVQLFASTHSLEALDAMVKSEAVRGEGIVAFRLAQAGTHDQPARFSGDMLHRLRYERGLDVR